MARRAGFALLWFTLAMFSSRYAFSQEDTAKKPAENAAAESNARFSRTHCEVPSCIQKVLYFSNLSQPTDLQDVVNGIRVMADMQRVQQVPGSQIIVIEGTAEQVAIAEKMAAEIDKDKRRFGGLGYRIDFKIQESEGDKKSRARLYSLVTEARQAARVSIERQAPAKVQTEPGSETKQPSDPSPARSIECRILVEDERSIQLSVDAAFASDTTNESSGRTPLLLRTRLNVAVDLDRPTVISRIDDPDGDRSFTIELTATRVKDRS